MTQVSNATFKSDTATLYADNTSGQISPADLRAQMDNIADSVPFKTTGKSTAPTANDDVDNTGGNGAFIVGDIWVDESNNQSYICLDSTATAAIWQQIGQLSDSQIKTAYENNSNTNAFTDAEQSKLSGIAVSATSNPNAIDNIVEDITPQLGGNLDFNSNIATSFESTGIDDNATSTAITIDASENVGIGTTSPALQSGGTGLHIHDASNSELKFTNTTTGSAGSQGTALLTSGLNFILNNREAGAMLFQTSNTEAMRIDNSGNLTVGGTASVGKIGAYTGTNRYQAFSGLLGDLEVVTSNNSNPAVYIKGTGTADLLQIFDNTAQVFTVKDGGKVGVRTSEPLAALHVAGNAQFDANTIVSAGYLRTVGGGSETSPSLQPGNDADTGIFLAATNQIGFTTAGSEAVRIGSSGNLGVGTSSATQKLDVNGAAVFGSGTTRLTTYSDSTYSGVFNGSSLSSDESYYMGANQQFWYVNGSEMMRLDSLGVRSLGQFLASSYSAATPDFSFVADNSMGMFRLPGILGFSNGGTEAARFDNSRNFLVGKTSSGIGTAGAELRAIGDVRTSVSNSAAATFNRMSSDGAIVGLYQESTLEGTISVSGTTISYNNFLGAHYSELVTDAEDLLMGTIAETAGGACEDEGNGRLPKFRVGETRGSKAVYGTVLGPAWTEEEDENVKLREAVRTKYRLSGVGAGWIRMKAGSEPELGDLIQQSDIRGCGEVQDDDIIRSKTVAKVTSLEVKETYADGSYVLPAIMLAG